MSEVKQILSNINSAFNLLDKKNKNVVTDKLKEIDEYIQLNLTRDLHPLHENDLKRMFKIKDD